MLNESGAIGDFGYAIREHRRGFLCGYLAIPPQHPWYGRDYDDLDVQVHGDLSYSEWTDERDQGPYPAALAASVWWIGFDCAHVGDILNGPPDTYMDSLNFMVAMFEDAPDEESYKDRDYVYAELESLASQAANAYRIGAQRRA